MTEEGWQRYATVYEPIAVASIDGSDVQPHDKAVIRALDSSYKPNQKINGNPNNTIFIGRLHPNVTSSELRKIFSEYGEIVSCNVIRDIVTAHSRRYGFVEYEKRQHTERAYKYGHRKLVKGAEILVDYEVSRTMPGWVPRSMGGGFGGCRESGQLRFGCRHRPWERPLPLHGSRRSHR